MASYKSQYNPPRRTEEQTPYPQRAPSTRLPQRSVTPTSNLTPRLPAASPSKLQKKKYTRDEPIPRRTVSSGLRAPTVKSPVIPSTRQGSTTPIVPLPHSATCLPIPKTMRQIPSPRPPKSDLVGDTRTPSLVSGSSGSTNDSPRSHLLRRKPSNIGIGSGKPSSRGRSESVSSQDDMRPIQGIPGGYRDPFSETVLGISLPPSSTLLARAEVELDPLETDFGVYGRSLESSYDILPPPHPLYAKSTTPSTGYSGSPGPFSISSTPTSMSSYSPGTALSSKSTTRTRQPSPLESKPPVARSRAADISNVRQQHGLSSVRESSSSSSASTVRGDGGKQQERSTNIRLPAPPPSPPPSSSALSPSQVDARSDAREKSFLSPTLASRSRFQAPPELAHLADQPQGPITSRRPSRPSRDGASDIIGLREPSPIIQSNMTSFPSSHRRTSSSDSKTGIVPGSRSRFGFPSKPSSRNPSPNPSLASGFAPISRVPVRGTTPDLQAEADHKRAKTAPSPSPSPAKTSRFGFFTRRAKTEPAPATSKPEKKLRRRGPAAGTGHEGYGKYSTRGRSGSTASGGSIGRSASAGTTAESLHKTPSSRKSSMTSTTSAEMDDFFLERLTPVVIRGTGSSSDLCKSPEPMHSGSSLDLSRRLSTDPAGPAVSQAPQANPLEAGRPTLLPSAMSDPVRSPTKRKPLGIRRPSESDDDNKRSFLPSLSSKRASRASKASDGAPLSKVASANSTTSKKSRKGSVAGQDDYVSDGKEGSWLKSKKSSAPSKPAKKWNFFQRAHATKKTDAAEDDAARKPSASRSVAHYALMDPKATIDLEDIEQIIQEADSSSEDATPLDNSQPQKDNPVVKERLQSMLLPPRPVLPPDFVAPDRPASPKVFLHPNSNIHPKPKLNTSAVSHSRPSAPSPQPDLTPVTDLSPSSSPFRPLSPEESTHVETVASLSGPPDLSGIIAPLGPPPSMPPPRPSRLPQVGRIPRVISRRDQERRPPSQSFSRPFIADQPRPALSPARTSFESASSLVATSGPVEPFPVLLGLDALNSASAIAGSSVEASSRQNEFFKFPPRKDSEVSYSSSSGVWSFPPTTGTAVVPTPGAPQSDDEIWNEYDDLIDEVLSPASSTGRQGAENNAAHPKQRPPLEPLKDLKKKTSESSVPSVHLRRSRLLAVLHSAQTPTSPMSFSDMIAGYGDRSMSVVDPVTGRLSFPSTKRMSGGSGPQNRPGSTRSSLRASARMSARQSKATLASVSDKDRDSATASRYRDTRLMEMAETQADGLVSMANLRFGALMTSKWLSFGRVLFSPVHFELKDPNEDRVLVVDGLGRDWSYYCALTYSEATIYHLGPGTSAPNTAGAGEPWSTLSNHRHISHPSLTSPFPFPRGFFACVVVRFPAALPSAVLRNVISECKRVLRPGGYVELSVLDLDLVNMGNRARRAIRTLKVQMQVADPTVSLRNISDEIMGALGRKGFTECNRCFVGIPVAGKLPGLDDGSDAGSQGKKRKESNASSKAAKTGTQSKPEISYSDLLNTQSSHDSATDDGITDMVARVGRWWYSRCYESIVLPEATPESENLLERSIWKDEGLLRECENRGTSFRLLIGYAQKPEVGVRRTVSV